MMTQQSSLQHSGFSTRLRTPPIKPHPGGCRLGVQSPLEICTIFARGLLHPLLCDTAPVIPELGLVNSLDFCGMRQWACRGFSGG